MGESRRERGQIVMTALLKETLMLLIIQDYNTDIRLPTYVISSHNNNNNNNTVFI